MSQHAERARAIRVASKLINTNGRTENEVEQAMDRLQQIMTTFNLTINDIVLETADYRTVTVNMTKTKGCSMNGIVVAIASFTDTKVWKEPGHTQWVRSRGPYGYECMKRHTSSPGTYKFFGIDQDVQYAEFLYNMIRDSLPSAEAKFKRSDTYSDFSGLRGRKLSALVSFRHGYIDRLRHRLNEMRKEMNRDIHEQDVKNGGTDIVTSKATAREAKFKDMLGIKLSSSKNYATGGSSSSGYSAGRESANSVNLSRPMGNSSGTLALK